MHMLSRRRLLAGSALVGASALAACSVSSSGTTTTGTLNVAKVDDYFQAGVNFVTIALGTAVIVAALGPAGVAAVDELMGTLTAAEKAFVSAAGSSVTVSINTASVESAFTTGEASLKSLYTQFYTVIASLAPASITSDFNTAFAAFGTIVSLAEALFATVTAASPMMGVVAPSVAAQPRQTMTEAEALAVLGVR